MKYLTRINNPTLFERKRYTSAFKLTTEQRKVKAQNVVARKIAFSQECTNVGGYRLEFARALNILVLDAVDFCRFRRNANPRVHQLVVGNLPTVGIKLKNSNLYDAIGLRVRPRRF